MLITYLLTYLLTYYHYHYSIPTTCSTTTAAAAAAVPTIHRESQKGASFIFAITLANANRFLADRTIGRAFGTLCRLSVVCLSVCLSSVTFCIQAKRLDRFA